MNNDYKYDILKMYFGDDYWVTDKIVIHQPTIGEIIEYGESDFWSISSILCANTTSMRLSLWKNGIDWNKISDFDLFVDIIGRLDIEHTKIFFKQLDFTKFRSVTTDENKIVLVYMPDPIIQIDEEIYNKIIGYLRNMLDIHPKVEKARGKATKESLIWEDEKNLEIELKKQQKSNWKKSILFPLISAALNHPGFKYKKSELKEIGIVEFMDSIKRLQVYENVTALMTGMYMGMVDLNGMNLEKELNWTRELYEK